MRSNLKLESPHNPSAKFFDVDFFRLQYNTTLENISIYITFTFLYKFTQRVVSINDLHSVCLGTNYSVQENE